MTLSQNEKYERFVRLYTANQPAVRAYVRRLVPTWTDADEVMQEVGLVLWRKFDETMEDNIFRNWSFGVARFEVLAWRRDRARNRLVLAEDLLELVAEESAVLDNQMTAQREALQGCLKKMPSRQRDLIVAAYTEGARIADIAGQAGRTITAFYQWLHRMRLVLLTCVRRAMGGELYK